jgi:hypothetical protein
MIRAITATANSSDNSNHIHDDYVYDDNNLWNFREYIVLLLNYWYAEQSIILTILED